MGIVSAGSFGIEQRKMSLRELAEAAALAVVALGIVALFLLTDFSSTQQTSNNLSRFIWALTHIAFPTSELAIYIELILSAIGGLTISRGDVRITVFSGFLLYFLINFIDAWFVAPVQ